MSETFDIAIIGGGVVGCAMARRFALEGARVVLLEKGTDVLDGASKANSAILHTGFDAPPGSLELACIREGHAEYLDIHARLGLPLDHCSAYVVAWSEEEAARLPGIVAQAHENGVTDVAEISAGELARAEPALARHAHGAVRVPHESLIDPWSAPLAYLRQALANGAEVRTSAAVTGGEELADGWRLDTETGPVTARWVINCAGLYGDLVDRALLGEADFAITPRKGQFVVYDKAASALVDAVILPVPTARTKGVVIFRTVFGNLAVGPTAEDQPDRADASTDEAGLKGLMEAGERMLPGLRGMPVTATYAGLRPASEFKDYQIATRPDRRWTTVGGIRSTGLSAALGIAAHVWRAYQETARPVHTAPAPPVWPDPAPVLAETGLRPRDWMAPDNGGIVCHCELVTRREVEAALEGPLAARSLAGLKRRTRVTMGRCQGFNCLGKLAALCEGRIEPPIAEPFGPPPHGGKARP